MTAMAVDVTPLMLPGVDKVPMRIVEPTGEIHEAAAVFPMLPEDELQELAADIKANGLIHPIVLDGEGVLIDGRNRLAACRIAGIEPTYTSMNGHDPVAYILSANIARRNLTKGQRAMAVARLNCLSQTNREELADQHGVSESRIAYASVVIRHAPDLVDAVMAGAKSLDAAYEEAKRNKERARSAESRLATLQAEAPELATLVVEENLTIDEAWNTWRERVRKEEEARRDLTKSTARAIVNLWAVSIETADKIIDNWVDDANTEKNRGDSVAHLWTGEGLRDLAIFIDELAEATDRRGGLNHGN